VVGALRQRGMLDQVSRTDHTQKEVRKGNTSLSVE